MVAPSVAADARWRRVLGRMQRRAGTPAAARLYWEMTMLREDVRDVLSGIAAPTLVMHSAGDTLVPGAQGRFLATGQNRRAAWATHAGRDLLEDHDRLVRRRLARYGDQDIKFTGDASSRSSRTHCRRWRVRKSSA
jgi:pimeloyl-ACP methyl ester carboxylesterase